MPRPTIRAAAKLTCFPGSKSPSAPVRTEVRRQQGFNDLSTGEGGTSMGFYNVTTGDVPYLNSLAHQYTLLDNMHQSVMGGTGANHIALGYADAMWYTDGNGSLATPLTTRSKIPIRSPAPITGSAEDGYSGGSYTNCSDKLEPGVAPVVNYLGRLSPPISPNCDPGHYYLLNNYNPGYNGTARLIRNIVRSRFRPRRSRTSGMCWARPASAIPSSARTGICMCLTRQGRTRSTPTATSVIRFSTRPTS